MGGNTTKGAAVGSMIDPVGGAAVGALAGRHKRNRGAAQGPATSSTTIGSTPYAPPQYSANQGPMVNNVIGGANPWGASAPPNYLPNNKGGGATGAQTQQMSIPAKGR